MLKEVLNHKIPTCLSHHTSYEGLIGILTNNIGKLTFRAVSNRYKNDPEEIKMGMYIFEKAKKEALPQSLLHRLKGYEDSASISFTEGEVNSHMISEYGLFRLDLDLREYASYGILDNFVECEYVAKKDLEEYANEYAIEIKNESLALLKAREQNSLANKLNSIIEYYSSSFDLIAKVFSVKEESWKIEKEWRKVIQLNESDEDVKWVNGKPYKNITFPYNALSGITIFFHKIDIPKVKYISKELRRLLKRLEIDAYVKIHFIEDESEKLPLKKRESLSLD